MFLAAALGGLAWIAVPAWLKLKVGINEIISTLLLNYVALNFLLHLLYGSWKDPVSAFPNSEQFDLAERLPDLGWENLTYALPLAIVLAVLCWWLLSISRPGFFMRFASANPKMARAIGIPLGSVVLGSALLSGALSGIAGFAISAGIEYRTTQSFFIGYGFSGILIGFLARNNPLAVVPVALFVAVLFVAGQSLQVFYQIPGAMVQLIQAIIVISVAASDFFIRHRIHWTR
jgi:simple sugar transport system permease protein